MSSDPTSSTGVAVAPPPPAHGLWTYRAGLRRAGVLIAIGQFGGMALGFLSNILLVRIADPHSVASYLLLLQAIMAIGLLLQVGLGPAVVRFVPLTRGEGGTRATAVLRRRLLGLQVGVWLLVVPPLAIAWPGLSWRLGAPELADATALLVATAVILSFNNLADPYLRVFRLYTLSSLLAHLLPRVVVTATFLALFLQGRQDATWLTLAGIYFVAQFATMIGYAAALPATTPGETAEPRVAQPPPGMWPIFTTTVAMGLRGGISLLFVAADLWILAWTDRPHAEVAIYGVMATLLQLMGAIPTVATLIVPQELAALHADGRRRDVERLARSAATVVGMLSLATFAGFVLLGRPLIAIAFGDTYVAGWTILLILAVGRFWDAAVGSAGALLQTSGHHVLLLGFTLAATVCNVGLSLVLAPRWGGHGVAIASSLSLIAINTAMVLAARRKLGVRTFVYLKPHEWLDVAKLLLARDRRAR